MASRRPMRYVYFTKGFKVHLRKEDRPMKLNCWEHKKCGRGPGGENARQLGVCPVATASKLDTAHGGTNAGRACWVVAGSLCGGKIQGTYAEKLANCWRCDFMNMVKQEEEGSSSGFSYTLLGVERSLEKRQVNAGSSAAAKQ